MKSIAVKTISVLVVVIIIVAAIGIWLYTSKAPLLLLP